LWTFILSPGNSVLENISVDVGTTVPVAQAKSSSGLPSQPRV
jgi:hypothetical protein